MYNILFTTYPKTFAMASIPFSVKNALFGKVRKARRQVPVTYQIGWWPNQDQLKIDRFTVDILKSRLNLTNRESLLSYTVCGQIKYKGHWKPFIKEVHVSERLFAKDSQEGVDAEILITPIVDVNHDKSSEGGAESFLFTNEHIISSLHWGVNKIRFSCGPYEQIIELVQGK